MDRRQLLLVLEQSLYVLLSQALLILSNEGGMSLREKQLLRRELGAELGSLTESMRRYVQKHKHIITFFFCKYTWGLVVRSRQSG